MSIILGILFYMCIMMDIEINIYRKNNNWYSFQLTMIAFNVDRNVNIKDRNIHYEKRFSVYPLMQIFDKFIIVLKMK